MSLRLIVLGLSTFTRSVIEYVKAHGDVEIIAVDSNEDRVNPILPLIDRPYIGDATDPELLRKLGIDDADRVLISMPNIESSLLCLLYVRDLNARFISVRAASSEHVKLLRLLHVDEIIFPEKQMSEIYGIHLLNQAFTWARGVGPEVNIAAIACPQSLEEKTIAQLEEKFGIQVIAVVHPGETLGIKPPPELELKLGDEVIVLGGAEHLTKFARGVAPKGSHGRLVPWTWSSAITGG